MSEHIKSEHVMSSKMYYGIWAALMCLTVVTAAVSFVDLGPLNTIVALVIATFKALLVVLFFMHVKYTSEKNDQGGNRIRDFLAFYPAGSQSRGLHDTPPQLAPCACGLTCDILRAALREAIS